MKKLQKEQLLYGAVGLTVGVLLTSFTTAFASNNHHNQMHDMLVTHAATTQQKSRGHADMSMADMTDELRYKTGDDFDKAFIEMMIQHHEGAVEMAQLIPANAKHDEIKKLGEAIIAAQTKEIGDMKQWQQTWGYGQDETNHMMHGSH